MTQARHGQQCLGGVVFALLLFGLAICGIVSCDNSQNAGQSKGEAEQARRQSLTPAQRAEEDRIAVEEEAARKQKAEASERAGTAVLVSQEYVRKYLAFPDDGASFGSWDAAGTESNPAHDVFACCKVKAKNVFGAELTYPWHTIVLFTDNKWQVAEVGIGDKIAYQSKELLTWIASRTAANDAKVQAADAAKTTALRIGDLEQQLAQCTQDKIQAERGLADAKQRLAEATKAVTLKLRDNAEYAAAKAAADQAESQVKQMRASDSDSLPAASAKWIEMKAKLQAVVNPANKEAGVTAAQLRLDEAQRRVIDTGNQIAGLQKEIAKLKR